MTVEIIQAIGIFIVTPVCGAGVFAYLMYLISKE